MEQLRLFSQFIEKKLSEIRLPQNPANLYDPLTYFFSIGGKRIRPLLTLIGAEMFDFPFEKAVNGALAIEYFHNFSLIHDDIMDEAPLRRSFQTVHTKWNNNIAILSGDVLLVLAYQELCKQDAKVLPELLTCFSQTAIEVCEGQQMDMDFEKSDFVQINDYIEMIRLKTSVLLGCALKFGAIIAETTDKNKQSIYDFGVNLGIAFQIQDDFLDLFANPETFGKQVGGDIIANKKTLLTLKAKELVGKEEFEVFTQKAKSLNDHQKVDFAKEYFTKIGVKKEVLSIRDNYFTLAQNSLDQIKITEEKKQKINSLVDFLKEREV
jgi:geranylgeranyl diphosphate synthase, type II